MSVAIDTRALPTRAAAVATNHISDASNYYQQRQTERDRHASLLESAAIHGTAAKLADALDGLVANTDFSDAAQLGRTVSRVLEKTILKGNVADLAEKVKATVDKLWDFSVEAVNAIPSTTAVDMMRVLAEKHAALPAAPEAESFLASLRRMSAAVDNDPIYDREYGRPRWHSFMCKLETDQDIQRLLAKPFTAEGADLKAFCSRFIDLFRDAYQLPEVELHFGQLRGAIGKADTNAFRVTIDLSPEKISNWAELGDTLAHELRHLNQALVKWSALKTCGGNAPAWLERAIGPRFHIQGMLNALTEYAYTTSDAGSSSGAYDYSASLLERDARENGSQVKRALAEA